jgi:hypothetical protein
MILTGCSTSAQLKAAAKDKGVAAARVHLPPLPTEQREDTPHAVVKVGDEPLSILKAERRQLDKANAKRGRFVNLWDDTAKALK